MHGWIALAVAVAAYLVKMAFDYGTMKGLLKQITESLNELKKDFESMKSNIVYDRNCSLNVSSLRDKIAMLETAKTAAEKELSELKTQLARMEQTQRQQNKELQEIKTEIRQISKELTK